MHTYIYIYAYQTYQPRESTYVVNQRKQPSNWSAFVNHQSTMTIYIYIFIYTMLVNHPQHTAMNHRITINISEPPSTTINHYGSLQAAINENLGLWTSLISYLVWYKPIQYDPLLAFVQKVLRSQLNILGVVPHKQHLYRPQHQMLSPGRRLQQAFVWVFSGNRAPQNPVVYL